MATTLYYSMGGSDRLFRNDVGKLKSNGITFQTIGLVSYGSKKYKIGVSSDNESKMAALGFKKTKDQPNPKYNNEWFDRRDNPSSVEKRLKAIQSQGMKDGQIDLIKLTPVKRII